MKPHSRFQPARKRHPIEEVTYRYFPKRFKQNIEWCAGSSVKNTTHRSLSNIAQARSIAPVNNGRHEPIQPAVPFRSVRDPCPSGSAPLRKHTPGNDLATEYLELVSHGSPRDSNQAIASPAADVPISAASFRKPICDPQIFSQVRFHETRIAGKKRQLGDPFAAPIRLSVSRDRPTGENATMATPSSAQVCTRPRSGKRVDREYSDCTAAIG